MDSKENDLELRAKKFMYVFMSRQQNSGQNHNIKKKDNNGLNLIAKISRVD